MWVERAAHLVLTDHGGGLARFLFLCVDAAYRKWSKVFNPLFQPDLSTVITATSLKWPKACCNYTFLTALVWLETLLCLLIFSRLVLGGCVAISESRRRHPFHWNLVTIMVRCTIRFVILYRKGIYEIHQRKVHCCIPLSALVLFLCSA